MTKEALAFFKELSELCDRYRADIWGCGCHGSPRVRAGGEEFDKFDKHHGEPIEMDYGILDMETGEIRRS